MPYPQAIKELAYRNDPECWISYSGAPRWRKREMDGRRSASLGTAVHQMMESILSPKPKEHTMAKEPFFIIEEMLAPLFEQGLSVDDIETILFVDETAPKRPRPKPRRNPPMKISMLLHFYACIEPFAPEKCRTSPAYTQFVKELLRDELIERPSKDERAEHPGWAYRTTAKGSALVNAICTLPNPIERTRWVMPKSED